jgi:hypothetical protein
VNKHILVDLNFPFPCTVAALGITGTSIISCLAVRLLRLGNNSSSNSSSGSSSAKGNSSGNKAGVSWWFYCTYIVPAGLCVALAMQLGNTAYLYLSGEQSSTGLSQRGLFVSVLCICVPQHGRHRTAVTQLTRQAGSQHTDIHELSPTPSYCCPAVIPVAALSV